MPDPVDILKKETLASLSWLEQSQMIASPENVHANCLEKVKQILAERKLTIKF